jgi:deoxyhypusine synthase
VKLPEKTQLLSRTIEHIDITRMDVVPIVESMGRMAFSARDLSRAADIYDRMLRDDGCGIIRRRSPVGAPGRRSAGPNCGAHPLQVTQMRAPTGERLPKFLGTPPPTMKSPVVVFLTLS